jgi:uncharacterized protein YhfF
MLLNFDMSTTRDFWERCRRALPDEPLGERWVLRRMGNTPALCESLLGLIASGDKTGGFSRPEELAAAGLTPAVGDYVILTDYHGAPRCLVRMEECRLLKFGEIGAKETACESPAARDPEVWRGIHRGYWTPVLAAEGKAFSEDLPVLFQRFRLLYSEPA